MLIFCLKSVQIRTFGPYFSVFGLNTGIYSANLRISPNMVKQGPEKSVFEHFLRSVMLNFVLHIEVFQALFSQ